MKVPDVYIINLDKDVERLEKISQRLNKFSIPFTRIEGIYGRDLSKKEIKRVSTVLCRNFCTRSQIGCYLSHLKTWKKIAESSNEYGLVMEDDCFITDDFVQKVKQLFNDNNHPGDFIYLGCFGGCGDETFESNIFNIILPPLKNTINSTSNLLEIPKTPIGFHCYLISRQCAKLLANKLVNFHIDVDMINNFNKLNINVYSFKKPIAYQYSTNSNSTISDVKFPRIINYILDKIIFKNGISLGYYLGAQLFSIGPFSINVMMLLIILLLLFCKWNTYILLYLLLELFLFKTNVNEQMVILTLIGMSLLSTTF